VTGEVIRESAAVGLLTSRASEGRLARIVRCSWNQVIQGSSGVSTGPTCLG
jgi:hypothetical protein